MDIHLRRNRILALLIAITFFIAIAPTLPWQQFSSGPENLVIGTSMEMRRGGPWLIPTLQGEPRLAKPPLAAWITAKSIWGMTVDQIDILDPMIRDRAYAFMAIEARWPALLATCGMLLGILALGRAIRDSSLGLIAVAVGASSYFLLRFCRYATTDIYLALCVTWASAFLAQAVLRRRYWRGFIGAGIAMGLAMLSKGPVCLVQSVLPVVVYVIAMRRITPSPLAREGRGEGESVAFSRPIIAGKSAPPPHPNPLPQGERGQRQFILPLLIGVAIFLAIGMWWFVLVWLRYPDVTNKWFSEVTRIGATETPPGPILTYVGILFLVLPWTVFFVVGMIVIVREIARRRISPDALTAMLVIVPLIVMTFAKDRQDRYALPMIAPAAIVVAIGVLEHLRSWKHPTRTDALVLTLHWLTLAAIAVALPILASTRAIGQQPWFTPRFAAIEAALGGVLVLIGIMQHRRRPGGLVSMTFITMLVVQAVIFRGYCQSRAGLSDMKPLAELIAARYPDAIAYNAHPTGKRPPTDLGVYLNRAIRWTGDPSTLTADKHPVVLFMLQNRGEPEPVPPAGWEFVLKAPRDKDWWWAFVLAPS